MTTLIIAHAAREISDSSWALHGCPADTRVVTTHEPIEAPIAASLYEARKIGTLAGGGDASILGTPVPASVLGRATVERTDPSPRHKEIELVASKVPAGICRLDDHDFPSGRARSER